MTQRTRYFMFGSALVMIVGLATGLVAFYNSGLPLRASSSGPAELAYVPADATGVAFADVRTIMNSDFRQRLRQVLPSGEEKDKLFAETGIDLERDIDTVVAGLTGSDPLKGGALVLVRGRFNDPMIETLAVQHGATVETYKGKRLILMTEHAETTGTVEPQAPTGESHTGAIAFLEPGLLALGEVSAVRRGIDVSATHEDVTKNEELMKFVSEMQGSGDAWVVGRVDAISNQTGVPQQVKDQMAAVQWMAASVRINTGVSGQIRAEARDDQSAEQLRAVVNGALAAGRLVSGNDPKATAMLNAIQPTGVGKTVGISFTLPPEIIDIINGVAGLNNLHSDKPATGGSSR